MEVIYIHHNSPAHRTHSSIFSEYLYLSGGTMALISVSFVLILIAISCYFFYRGACRRGRGGGDVGVYDENEVYIEDNYYEESEYENYKGT